MSIRRPFGLIGNAGESGNRTLGQRAKGGGDEVDCGHGLRDSARRDKEP